MTPHKIPVYQIDSFTDQAFGGNPAAVCPLEAWCEDALLQKIARENNLSETAFLVPDGDAYEIRWFAPCAEVRLCGHATLAAATVVFRFLQPDLQELRFRSPYDELQVERQNDGFLMDFPRFSYLEKKIEDCPHELRTFGLCAVYEGNETLVLRLESEVDVHNYQANLDYLKKRGIYLSVTAPGEHCDFVSRFFAPAVGIDEDPVTGSVHCLLAPIWANILGKTQLEALQLSDRQGKLILSLADSRVKIFGQAVCVMQGEIYPKGM